MFDLLRAKDRMIEAQLRRRGITDERVLEAMAEVPRERFVKSGFEEFSYEDSPLAIGEGRTMRLRSENSFFGSAAAMAMAAEAPQMANGTAGNERQPPATPEQPAGQKAEPDGGGDGRDQQQDRTRAESDQEIDADPHAERHAQAQHRPGAEIDAGDAPPLLGKELGGDGHRRGHGKSRPAG